jgi:hypothetical protein
MAQEDYLSGSQFGQVAGSLLASKRKQDKKSFKKALLATALFEGVGALQKQQKQTIMDNAQDVKEKYNDIFTLNQAEFDSYSDERNLVKRYNDNQERFLNEEVAKIIDNTDEAVAARVKWADVDSQPKELRDSMYEAYNDEREKLINKMEALKVDPRATTRTFAEFNRRAKDEYMAALKLVEDDPTKKGLMRAAWNRIFKTKVDEETGELVSTNEKLLKLQKDLEDAKASRSTFRDQIENQVAVKHLYTPLVFKDKSKSDDELYAAIIPTLRKNAIEIDRDKYGNITGDFFIEVIDQIKKDNQSLTTEQLAAKAYTEILKGNVSTESYLTREGLKIANGRAMVSSFDLMSKAEQRETFEEDPMTLFQVMGALKADGRETEAIGLSELYKDIYTDNKDYEVTQQEKQNYVEDLVIRLDKKKDKALLNDTAALGHIAKNAAHAEKYFKRMNPGWEKMGYDPQQIEQAALNFVLNKMESEGTQVKMTSADLLQQVDISEIQNLPKHIKQLNKAGRSGDLQTLKDQFVEGIQNPLLELDDDEVIQAIKDINKAFKNEDVVLDDVDDLSDKVFSRSSIVEKIPSLSEVDFNATPGIGGYYLKNADLLISKMDLQGLSDGQLLTLRATTLPSGPGDEGTLPQKLGLPKDISLDESKTSGMIPGLDIGDVFRAPKVREQLRQRIEDEMEIRMSKGKVFGRDRSSSNPATVMMMAKRKDFEDIPEDWWNQYVISNPIGISPPRGAAGRGTKYNPQG